MSDDSGMRFLVSLFALTTLAGCDLSALFAECDGDRDCGDDEECIDGECVELECESDGDCDPGRECNDNECERIDCTSDLECGEGAFCDLALGKCDETPGGEGEGEGDVGEGEGEGDVGEGEGEGEGDPCGGVPDFEQCNGDVIEICVDNSFVSRTDCNSSPFSFGQADCAFVDAVDSIECAVVSGASCRVGGNFALCAGTQPGCNISNGANSAFCETFVGVCDAFDVNRCDAGGRFVDDCLGGANGFGQPVFLDCNAMGAACSDSAGGCLFQANDFCVPSTTFCQDGANFVTCPGNGICPDTGGGVFTHHSGTGVTFTNDRPIDINSLQGAIDACNAHFGLDGVTATCGQGCAGNTCFAVVRNANSCICETGLLVWNYGDSNCYSVSDAPGNVLTIGGGACEPATVTGFWD